MFDIVYALNKFKTTVDEYEAKETQQNLIMFYGDSAYALESKRRK